jgi:hypothetical protein
LIFGSNRPERSDGYHPNTREKKKVFEYDENVEIVKKMGKKMKEKIQPKNNK